MRGIVVKSVVVLLMMRVTTGCLGGDDGGSVVEIGAIEELPADHPVLDLEQPALVTLDDAGAIDAAVDELQEQLLEDLDAQGIDLEQPALVPLADNDDGGLPLTGNICNDWGIKWLDVVLAFPDFSNLIDNHRDPQIWADLQTMYLVMADTWVWVASAMPDDRNDLSTNALALSDNITAVVPLITPDTIDQMDTSWHDSLALPVAEYVAAECFELLAGMSPADMIGGLLDLP
jgi:hypothetical protein